MIISEYLCSDLRVEFIKSSILAFTHFLNTSRLQFTLIAVVNLCCGLVSWIPKHNLFYQPYMSSKGLMLSRLSIIMKNKIHSTQWHGNLKQCIMWPLYSDVHGHDITVLYFSLLSWFPDRNVVSRTWCLMRKYFYWQTLMSYFSNCATVQYQKLLVPELKHPTQIKIHNNYFRVTILETT